MTAPVWFIPLFITIEVVLSIVGIYGWYKAISKHTQYISNLIPLILICVVAYIIVSSYLQAYLFWYWMVVPFVACDLGTILWLESSKPQPKHSKKKEVYK